MNQEKINFHIARDFSELFNIATKFLSQNFKHFFKTIVFIVGPFVLLSAIFGAFYQAHALSFPKTALEGVSGRMQIYSNMLNQFGWQYFALLFFSFCSGLVMLTTVYSYMIAYDMHGPKNFGIPEVKALVLKNIAKTIKGFAIFFLIMVVVLLVVSIVLGIFVMLLKIFAVVIVLLFMLGLLFISPPYLWKFSTFYLPLMTEDLTVSEAFGKVRRVMEGNFFSTWLLIFSTILVLIILGLVFSAPVIIYQIILQVGGITASDNTTPFIIVTLICSFFSKFVYSVFYIVCGFHYYSLSEAKEGAALLNRIDEIGNTPSNDVDQHY